MTIIGKITTRLDLWEINHVKKLIIRSLNNNPSPKRHHWSSLRMGSAKKTTITSGRLSKIIVGKRRMNTTHSDNNKRVMNIRRLIQ